MPFLLIEPDTTKRYVQMHMPRTGGHSLREDWSVNGSNGPMHGGPETIPEAWSEFPIVATFRPDPFEWRVSMRKYIREHVSGQMERQFARSDPLDLLDIDTPTFGLWEGTEEFSKTVAFSLSKTWYEAYVAYFIRPADRIVPISALSAHKNRSG